MDVAYSTHGKEIMAEFCYENLKGVYHLKTQGVDARTVLKWNLENLDGLN
jgi:hypothetical protein